MEKSKSQRVHAKTRALERFDIKLNRHKYKELVDMIQGGKATFLESQSNRVKIFLMEYENKTVRVVYDNKRKTVVTFLPLEPK